MSAAVSASDAVFGAIDRHYRPLRHGLEYLARDARVKPRTARNWWDKTNQPQFEQVANIMAANETIAAEIFTLVAEMRAARK